MRVCRVRRGIITLPSCCLSSLCCDYVLVHDCLINCALIKIIPCISKKYPPYFKKVYDLASYIRLPFIHVHIARLVNRPWYVAQMGGGCDFSSQEQIEGHSGRISQIHANRIRATRGLLHIVEATKTIPRDTRRLTGGTPYTRPTTHSRSTE